MGAAFMIACSVRSLGPTLGPEEGDAAKPDPRPLALLTPPRCAVATAICLRLTGGSVNVGVPKATRVARALYLTALALTAIPESVGRNRAPTQLVLETGELSRGHRLVL